MCMAANIITFDSPAKRWEEALPLGNGRLGAMVFGCPDRERIPLNEDSIWSGTYRDRNNPAAKDALAKIRRLLDEGRPHEAEELCLECFSGTPLSQRVYQSAGELHIDFFPDYTEPDSIEGQGGFGHRFSGTRNSPLLYSKQNYSRKLDMEKALHTLCFEYKNTVFTRECFISAPMDIMVIRFSAAGANGEAAQGKISFRAYLDRGVFVDRMGNIGDSAFISRDSDIPFCAMFKVSQRGGTQDCRGGFIAVHGADEALLFLDIRTGFRENDCAAACIAHINSAIAQADNLAQCGEQLLNGHIAEYSSWYNRLQLELDSPPITPDPLLYFNYSRYLLISCSRPGTLPANLQGLWNPHLDPPWGSDYTININTQMNYWPACVCNLAQCGQPLFDLLERMYPNGKKTAETMYGCRGFVAHHNTDIWGDTAPRDCWIPASYWVLGAAWLCLHIWEHYEYTQDKKFLEKYFYLIREACVFFVDFLIPGKERNESGEAYVTVSPSFSPENSYRVNGGIASISAGCEMDRQILRKLFEAALRSIAILGRKDAGAEADADIEKFRAILDRLPCPTIHSNGTIREWNDEYGEAEEGHRHFSHLWALWPGDSITAEETPGLARAAKKSIERRLAANGGHTGWSRAWLVNFMARLHEGEAAREQLYALFSDFTLPNLLNNGPPFQIDGNFGALSGMAQMLVQGRIRYNDSNSGFHVMLDMLPALPRAWASGSVRGIRAKGNLELDFSWHEGRLTSLVIRNFGSSVDVRLCHGKETHEYILPKGGTKIL